MLDEEALKEEARIEFEAFDEKRQKLHAAYEKARMPRTQLKALAKIVRHHGEFLNQNMLTGGWPAETILMYAQHIERIADSV
jgi:hypothetical protein